MKKIKWLPLLLCLCTFTATGCGDTSSTQSSTSSTGTAAGEIEFWSADVNEMILQDKPVEDYESIKQAPALSVQAVRNEYEAAQLLMTATKDVSAYDVTVTDLVSENGDTFKAENVEVYNQKYVYLSKINETYRGDGENGYGIGWYPDGMLPFATAKGERENKIEEGNNQALYFSFYIPEEQAAGTYTANFKVTYDGKEQSVPVSLKVWDLTLPEETTMKTMFLVGWNYRTAELGSTYAEYKKYLDALSKYRLSPYQLWNHNEFEDLDYQYEFHADIAYDWASNPRNTVYCIPYVLEYAEDGEMLFNRTVWEGYLNALVEKSFETKFNILEKAYAHFGSLIDEPEGQGTWGRVVRVQELYKETKAAFAEYVESNAANYIAEYGVTQAEVEAVADSIRNIRHVLTNNYNEMYDEWVDYYCPNWWWLNREGEENIDKYYGDQDEQWWYGCNGPNAPLPSYHTDDTPLSTRVISWMQAYYGVEGNLYWGVDVYWSTTQAGGISEDFFNVSETAPGGNGDGLLLYGGGMYGLDEPIPTRRIEQIRNGIEEYELLLTLKALYEEKGFSYDSVLEHMTEDMFQWMSITATSENFSYSRNMLFELLSLAQSDAQMCVLKAENDKVGNFTGEVFLKDGYTLKVNGEAATVKETVECGKIYVVGSKLDSFVNVITLEIPELTGVKTVTFKLYGQTIGYMPDQAMVSQFASSYANVEATLVSASDIYAEAAMDNMIKLDVAAVSETLQAIKFTSEAISGIGKNTSSMTMMFYNATDTEQKLSVEVKYKGQAIQGVLASQVLKPGYNVINISALNQKNWDKLKYIEYIHFVFGDTLQEDAKTVYFCGYTISNLE